jgi:hypothetical protein
MSPSAPRLFFPRVVDEVTVRLVAAQVLAVSTVAVATGWLWLFAPLALDFALRVAFGPRSPLAQVALRVLRPLVPAAERPTPGPPKRFAASIGVVCSALVVLFAYPLGWTAAAWVVAVMMVVFPLLEAGLGLCVGCQVFRGLMRVGWVPESVCLECADISLRRSPELA